MTQVAAAVIELQRALPLARVVYCSATGVTDISNLAFMERLGLWGHGTSFPTFDSFADDISARGLGALEMVSMELKQAGAYVSRALSFHNCAFEIVEAEIPAELQELYDTSTRLWKDMYQALIGAVARTRAGGKVYTAYWGAHQKFFLSLCHAAKVQTIVREAQAALEFGNAVVIGLQTTGEAAMDSELGRAGGDLNGFTSVTRETILGFMSRHFPTVWGWRGIEGWRFVMAAL